ncbi:MAG: hypothetical protein IT376_10135 [Polyangiaceae bacterium]|nr:hypothetical protein [Polyangiaceae bacterium]
MTDPPRLFETAGTLERELLRAGRSELPPSDAMERTLAALGAGVALGAAATSAAAATELSSAGAAAGWWTTTAAVVLKWAGLGAVGGLATMGVVRTVQPTAAPTEVVAPSPRRVAPPAPPAHLRAPAAEPGREEPAAPATARAAAARPPVVAASADPSGVLGAEVRALDGARAVLASGDPRGTLAALDRYQSEFPAGALAPEALYLRMTALERAGDSTPARVLAQRLVDAHPGSPQAARARALLAGPPRGGASRAHAP